MHLHLPKIEYLDSSHYDEGNGNKYLYQPSHGYYRAIFWSKNDSSGCGIEIVRQRDKFVDINHLIHELVHWVIWVFFGQDSWFHVVWDKLYRKVLY